MKGESVRLGARETQIVKLLMRGCDNGEIARQLKIARRTVKANLERLFRRFRITGGIKRVKLAILFDSNCLRDLTPNVVGHAHKKHNAQVGDINILPFTCMSLRDNVPEN